MANPIVLAGLGLGSTALGAVTSAFGSEQKGVAEAAMYNYQAGVANINAQLAKQDANYSLAAGEVSAEQAGMRQRAEIGATRAGFGASNIAGASKNAVIGSEIAVGQETQGIVRANAAKRAYGYSVGAAEDVAQAGAYTSAAATSKTAGELGAVSSILGGVGSVSSKWLQMGPAFGQATKQTQGGMGLYDDASTGSLY